MSRLVRIKHWPARPEHARFVAVYRQGNKRQVRYFNSDKRARAFAAEKEVELLNEGRRHNEISDAERHAVYRAREANVSVSEAVEAFIAQRSVFARSISLVRAVDEFLEARGQEGKSFAHAKDLRLRLGAFVASRTDESSIVAAIETRDVDAFLASLRVAPQTRLNYRRALHNFFSFCVARGYAARNVVTSASKVKVPAKVPEILGVAQTRALLEACSPEILPAVAIAAFAGLRHAEIARLSWGDIDLSRKFIEVKAANSKTAMRRLVTISPNLRAWFSLKSENHDGDLVHPAGVYRVRFAEACRAAGIERWLHNALRHSFASYHLAAHRDAARTALELGHTESRTLFVHYRELVTREDAKEYFKIFPKDCI